VQTHNTHLVPTVTALCSVGTHTLELTIPTSNIHYFMQTLGLTCITSGRSGDDFTITVILLCTLCTLNVVQHFNITTSLNLYNYCPVGANNILWEVASAVAERKPLRALSVRSCKRNE